METRRITPEDAAGTLLGADNILILTHKNPDGDAIGSGIAIAQALQQKGKHCRVAWSGELASFYTLITRDYRPDAFAAPEFVLAVDLASNRLLPNETAKYADCIDMVIDHHATSVEFAKETLLEADASCCAEIIHKVITAMGCEVTTGIANCIYVGLATDTGCFRYSNTTAENHILAAELVSRGVNIALFNELIFGQKSRARIEIERRALAGMEFTSNGKICIITITRSMLEETNCIESDIEGIATIPKAIEGVEAGVTLREQENGNWKISLRTATLDASEICSVFGGGGHLRAAGCECSGTPFEIKVAMVAAINRRLGIT
ncbi:MAG: bifunctional oligoribonuclease/PAP phosphatase NrnA [Oscillospiraceae bacterium]|nr:bifunctional oligoribonuclease/PAP phosphatase NrnA [Oscillospiraceae bacterium]